MIKNINKPMIFTISFVLALIALAFAGTYWFIVTLCAGWLIYDTNKRKIKGWYWWIILTLIFSPLIITFYLPKRPLLVDEKREGGYVWNWAKSFALLWTLTMASATFMSISSAANSISNMTNDYEIAGAGIGTAIGIGLIFGLWLFVTFSVLIIGFLLKKSIIEEGPSVAT
jgi:hypothetical protein